MVGYTFRRASIENDSEIKFIAEIDNTVPALFDSDFVVSEQINQDRMKFLKACKEEDFFDVALDGEKKIVAFHVVKRVPLLANPFISSTPVETNLKSLAATGNREFDGSRIILRMKLCFMNKRMEANS